MMAAFPASWPLSLCVLLARGCRCPLTNMQSYCWRALLPEIKRCPQLVTIGFSVKGVLAKAFQLQLLLLPFFVLPRGARVCLFITTVRVVMAYFVLTTTGTFEAVQYAAPDLLTIAQLLATTAASLHRTRSLYRLYLSDHQRHCQLWCRNAWPQPAIATYLGSSLLDPFPSIGPPIVLTY